MVTDFSDSVLTRFVQTQMHKGSWNGISEYGRLTGATYSTACLAISLALGQDWALKHIGRKDKGCYYFSARKNNAEELYRHMSRATEFGELIFNLHGVGGFNERISSIRKDEKSGIESGIAELIAGQFFKMTGMLFQYVIAEKRADGKTPKNPDIEYVAGSNRVEACEVKCNLQSTDLAEEPIKNILKKAKSQLPKGKTGIILLRVPETWFSDKTATTVIENAINGFIEKEKSTRVSSIFLFVSEMKLLPNEKMARAFYVKEFQNKYCNLRSGIELRLTDENGRWRNLQNWVSSVSGITLLGRGLLTPPLGLTPCWGGVSRPCPLA